MTCRAGNKQATRKRLAALVVIPCKGGRERPARPAALGFPAGLRSPAVCGAVPVRREGSDVGPGREKDFRNVVNGNFMAIPPLR
jgi:hypothetical protein